MTDLCPTPVDDLYATLRRAAYRAGEAALSPTIARLQPAMIATGGRGLARAPSSICPRHAAAGSQRIEESGMRILAVSGSLRAGTSNTALLEAVVVVAQQGVEVKLYEGLGELPHFNPDLEGKGLPQTVRAWQQALRESDALVVLTPEYAHGVPGVLKNALDWVTGSGELAGKPVALFNASSRSVCAQASLAETLTVDVCAGGNGGFAHAAVAGEGRF